MDIKKGFEKIKALKKLIKFFFKNRRLYRHLS